MEREDLENKVRQYQRIKDEIVMLQNELKDLEIFFKDRGPSNYETDTLKISVYKTKETQTFDIKKFQELNPTIDYNKPEYWNTRAGATMIKMTKKEENNDN